MSAAVYDPNQFILSITDNAKAFFEEKLFKGEALFIRLSVKKSGCTGYAYVVETVTDGESDDVQIEISGIRFFISSQAAEMIDGSEIDFVTQGLNKTIQFNNPNVTNSCGCGSSFSIE